MNSFEATQQIEKRFDQDRADKPNTPCHSPAKNALITTRSAPVKGLPKTATLVRSVTSLLTSNVEHALMDMWVDDGTNGNIGSTVRTLRFSTAASAIDGLFHSPIRNMQNELGLTKEVPSSAPGNLARDPFRSSESSGQNLSGVEAKRNAQLQNNSDYGSNGSQELKGILTPRTSEDAAGNSEMGNDAGSESAGIFKKTLGLLETEPITHPRPYNKQFDKQVNGSSQAPAQKTSFASSNKPNLEQTAPKMRRRVSKKDDTPGVRASPQGSANQSDAQFSKLESKLNLAKILTRKSARAGEATPSPGADSRTPDKNEGQKDRRGAVKVLQILKRRSTMEYPLSDVAENDSGHNAGSSNEQSDSSRKRGARKLAELVRKLSSGVRKRRNPERSTMFPQEEQAQDARGDRKTLLGLFHRFSSDSTEEKPDVKATFEENGEEQSKKGAFFANLFKKHSRNSTEEEETGTRPDEQRENGSHRESPSSPPNENETWWSELSERVTRFLIMLVH